MSKTGTLAMLVFALVLSSILLLGFFFDSGTHASAHPAVLEVRGPLDTGTLMERAQVAFQTGDLDRATILLKAVVGLSPENGDARRMLTLVAFQHGDYPEAVVQCQALLKQNPADTDAALGLAKAFTAQGFYPQAIAACKSLIASPYATLPQQTEARALLVHLRAAKIKH